MNTRELRIGSIVTLRDRTKEINLPTGVWYEVLSIKPFNVELVKYPFSLLKGDIPFEVSCNDVCYIEITTQILDENVFEVKANKWSKDNLSFFDYGKVFGLDVNEDIGTNFKYIHQLQDIYRLFNDGKEIEIVNKNQLA